MLTIEGIDTGCDGVRWRVAATKPLETNVGGVALALHLDVLSEETQQDDRICTALVPLRDGRFSPSRAAAAAASRHIDRWVGICRIVEHSVVNGVETCQQIAVRHLIDSQCRL